MRTAFLIAAIAIAGIAAHAQEAENRAFNVQPQYPTGGDLITITYNNSLTPLANSKTITGVIYICYGDDWVVEDLALQCTDGVWTATFTAPEESQLIACKFYGDDGKWDSGSSALNSYGMFVYTMNNDHPMRKPGTWMNRTLLFSKSLDKFAIPGYLKEEYKVDDKSTYETIRQELYAFPQMAEKLLYYVHVLLNAYEAGQHNEKIAADIEALLSNDKTLELSLLRAAEVSRNILKDQEKAKQIEATIMERFPDGLLARDHEIRKVFSERDKEIKFQLLEDFVKRFPPENFPKPQTNSDNVFYYRMFWQALRDLPEKRYSVDVLSKFLPLMPFADVQETYYRNIFLPYDKTLQTAAELRPYSEVIYAELIKRINGAEDLFYSESRRTRYSPKQWRDYTLYLAGQNIVTHAQILAETGSSDVALEIIEPLKTILDGKISVYNHLYAQLLAANGYTHLVVPFIEESIRADAATAEMLEILRADFAKKSPQGDFDSYMNGLRSDEYVANMEKKLLDKLIREKIEPFRLENMKGEVVNMLDLTGKVIVLDFWATWCPPCLAAMEGMKMVVEKYKENPDVVFFFVDTMERGGGYREFIPEFMAKKGYGDFNILYDDRINNINNGAVSAYFKQFNMSGIPQKMVIDQEGYARWVSGGYYGNPLELANEFSFQIEYLLHKDR